MTEPVTCPRCGNPIPADVPFGQCPQCLLELADMPGAEEPMRPHERFGDYELTRQLGRGAMGVVYEAVHLTLHRPVALKMILDSQTASPAVRRRFAIEAEAVAKLDHPNIVPIYEVGEWEGQPFLSMKFVQGESLRDKIARGEVGLVRKNGKPVGEVSAERVRAVARLMATIARAVDHAHRNGVLHRDLKPGNILIDAEGQPHLTDFGLAKLVDEAPPEGGRAVATVAGAILGTPSYMSPEQAIGRRLSTASDIYSLGAMLYELLAGRPPFKTPSAIETMRLVIEQEPKRPRVLQPQVPKDLDTICMKCLEKNAAARYESAGALAEDLERWLEQRPIRARTAGPMLRLRRWVERNPAGAALILSLCCGLAVALVLLHQATTARQQSEFRQAALLLHLTQQIQDLWNDPNKELVDFTAFDLAALCNYTDRPMDQANTLKLTFSLNLSDNPLGRATAYGPMLRAVENKMERLLGRPVVFDLRVYKSSRGLESPAARGEVDFQRMGVLDYLRAREVYPGLDLVVRERTRKSGVIFARQASGIKTLAEVAGRRVAFAHTNSIISSLAMVRLAEAGITGTNLAHWEHLNTPPRRGEPNSEQDSRLETGTETDREYFAHRSVIDKVVAGEFDVGEAQSRHFQRFRHHGLVELCRYEVTPDVYVARPGLAPEIVLAFRQSLLSLQAPREKRLVEELHSVTVEGFDAVDAAAYSQLRRELAQAMTGFGSR